MRSRFCRKVGGIPPASHRRLAQPEEYLLKRLIASRRSSARARISLPVHLIRVREPTVDSIASPAVFITCFVTLKTGIVTTEVITPGSIINLYNSANSNSVFKCCRTVYEPPVRNYTFDESFLDINRIPPGSPYLQAITLTGFERVND
jgi:hypothetical protein